MHRIPLSHLNELCDIFKKIRNRSEALALFKDILTPRELVSVVERWQIVKCLIKGMPHRKISQTLKVSIDKVTRGAKALKYNHGGFRMFYWRKH